MKILWKNHSYAIILLLVSCLTAGAVHFFDQPVDSDTYMTVKIKEGDSLWKVAGELADGHDMDRSEIIYWVRKKNSLKGDTVYPGDELVVPVKKFGYGSEQQLAGVERGE
ncbi:LysM peptidoglycan-binding domain-containing protein [Neobacillus notoginsengisoli]|uniref:LysM peptidoglycan-binding domain-containing protein n=1 Tax=Neobacillus notoginsengisoli TaxID=1578198 RepID=A0A417YRD8_9BACI|nr:LysM peptidoglycan-binding domain-containing protein [Neobacillus notoginsengisoli]RHW37960.1 LysM peptidoglycan-binding domain-containing protein [Neobacillus notoginsengisoli]